MVNLNINFEKKDLWLVSAIFVFVVGVGLVIGYNYDYPTDDGIEPEVHGHTVDEIFGGSGMEFGEWDDVTATYSLGDSILAQTDGFVVLYANPNMYDIIAYTGGCGSETLILRSLHMNVGDWGSITMPVKSGDCWKVTADGTTGEIESLFWIPIISSGGAGFSDIKIALIDCVGDCSNEGTANEICNSRFGAEYLALSVDCENVAGGQDENRDMDMAIDWCADGGANDMTITCYM